MVVYEKNNQNQRIEVAHSQQEMLSILDGMRLDGFNDQDINIITKDSSQLDSVKWDGDVKTHEAGNWVDHFKSWFTGDTAESEGLKRFELTEGQIAYYGQLLEQGAIILYAEREDTTVDPDLTTTAPFIDTIDNTATNLRPEDRPNTGGRLDDDNVYRKRI